MSCPKFYQKDIDQAMYFKTRVTATGKYSDLRQRDNFPSGGEELQGRHFPFTIRMTIYGAQRYIITLQLHTTFERNGSCKWTQEGLGQAAAYLKYFDISFKERL
jgi:hypothetical protein